MANEPLIETPPSSVAAVLVAPGWAVGVGLAACAALAAVTLVAGTHPHDRGSKLLLAIAACGPILLLRRWPLPVLGLSAAASGAEMALGNVTPALGVLLGVAAFGAGSRLGRTVALRAGLATAVLLGSALGVAALREASVSLAAEAVDAYFPLVAGFVVGDATAARRRYLAGLDAQAARERAAEAERARQAVREERVRIARELHDVVAHTLAVITVQAGVGRRLMARRPEEAANALESIEAVGRTAQEELRVVLGLLRERDGEAAELAPAPRLADLQGLVEHVRAAGTTVDLRTSGADRPLSPALELSLFRVVQEALTNVVKHAPVARARVDLSVSTAEVRLEVTNEPSAPHGAPGTFPPPMATPAAPGHGIVGMRERVGAFGGSLLAEPLGRDGFHVLARVPLEGAV